MAIFQRFVHPYMARTMWHPLRLGQSALALMYLCNWDSPSSQSVSNLEPTVITCPWPKARTGCSRGTSRAPQGLFMGVKHRRGPLPISSHCSWGWVERTGDRFCLYWDVDVGGRSARTVNTDYCISSYSYCVALP